MASKKTSVPSVKRTPRKSRSMLGKAYDKGMKYFPPAYIAYDLIGDPIMQALGFYEKGGKVGKKPKGCGSAMRGYGKAMKGSK